MSDTNPELPDELDPKTKKRLAEREASDVSVKELVENGKIIMIRGRENSHDGSNFELRST